MTGTFWAILPPVIAIILALVTKEVYLLLNPLISVIIDETSF